GFTMGFSRARVIGEISGLTRLVGRSMQGACMLKRLCLILLLSAFLPVHGQGSDELESYFQSVRTLQGEFEQLTKDESGAVIEHAHGSMSIQRPDRFRWSYDEPFEQEIIADGSKLWVYDVE